VRADGRQIFNTQTNFCRCSFKKEISKKGSARTITMKAAASGGGRALPFARATTEEV
jgi:hypothetical protein